MTLKICQKCGMAGPHHVMSACISNLKEELIRANETIIELGQHRVELVGMLNLCNSILDAAHEKGLKDVFMMEGEGPDAKQITVPLMKERIEDIQRRLR